MIRKTIAYIDYNGDEREEDFYFNLSRTELTKMEMETEGGLERMIIRLSQSSDGGEIMNILESIILRSYGIKTPDGKRLMKSKELSEEFKQTPAYDELFTELITDAEAAAKFINNVIPDETGKTIIPKNDTKERIAKLMENNPVVVASKMS